MPDRRRGARLPTLTLLAAALLLAACAPAAPTPTPTAALSGPTLEASPTFAPDSPADAPADLIYEGQNNPTAAALAPGAAMPPLVVSRSASGSAGQTVEITAEDGSLLFGDLYVNTTVLAPGVLLLAEERSAWGDFPALLHANGLTVLVMSVRPAAALADFRVMLQTLINGVADPARIGVVGAGQGADVALLGCAADLLCDAAALLSPSNTPSLVEAVRRFNPRPLFLTASQEDTEAFSAVQAAQAAATGEVLFQPFERAGSGTALLQNRPDLGNLILAWLQLALV
ncbi:MAG: hypothetical protein HXY41_01900 [Chloroflexi bacterium]|nr:hypothetical protein [Chloroflexota bacterium]